MTNVPSIETKFMLECQQFFKQKLNSWFSGFSAELKTVSTRAGQ